MAKRTIRLALEGVNSRSGWSIFRRDFDGFSTRSGLKYLCVYNVFL